MSQLSQESIVMSEDTGNDLSHVNMLKTKFDEFMSELQGYNEHIKEIDEEAKKLVSIPRNLNVLHRKGTLIQMMV